MPYDSNGNANVTRNIAVTGQTVEADQVNVPFDDIQTMLSQVILRSGVAPMTGSFNANGFRVLNVGTATASGDAVPKSQLDDEISDLQDQISAFNQVLATKTADYATDDDDFNYVIRFTAAATLTIDDAANLRDNWTIEVWAEGGNVVIDPSGTQTINGSETILLQTGQRAKLFKVTATTLVANITSDAQSGAQLQGFLYGLRPTKNATDANNDVDIAVGSAASDTSPYTLMRLATALTKRIDASWSVGNNAGGMDTGSVSASGTYYIWLIQRPDTGVVDALFSTSSTAPTMPANYTRKRLIGKLVRTSSVNGYPTDDIDLFISAQQTISLGSYDTVAHGLGVPPSYVSVDLVCVGSDLGYAAGEVVHYGTHAIGVSGVGNLGGLSIEKNATNLIIRYPATGMFVWNKSTANGALSAISTGDWRVVVTAKR